MFKFFLQKGLYNLVIKAYDRHLPVLNNRKKEIFQKTITQKLPAESFYTEVIKSRQEYFALVFNDVCESVGGKIYKFKHLLPLKIMSFDFNPDELRPQDIYKFVYWAITDKDADSVVCEKINHYVTELIRRK